MPRRLVGKKRAAASASPASPAMPSRPADTTAPAAPVAPPYASLVASLSSSLLPQNYTFELIRTIQRIERQLEGIELTVFRVGLQAPEGLLGYMPAIGEIIVAALGTVTAVQYVFVEIDIDVGHAVDSLAKLLGSPTDLLPLLRDAHGHPVAAHDMASCPVTLYIVCTIQFAAAAAAVRTALTAALAAGADAARAAGLPDVRVASPQAKPLSPGEILGCTAPVLADTLPTADAPRTTGGIIVYLGDGRFHLESIMLANPHLTAIRYDPYDKRLTQEEYGHSESRTIRRGAIEAARSAKVVGIILGGLGRQGNPAIVGNLRRLLDSTGIRHFTLVLSEVFPAKLAAFSEGEEKVDAFVQVACPRLSIDWGHFFTIPLLNTFEAFVAFDPAHAAAYPEPDQLTKSVPMDYYAKVGGPWANYHPTNKGRSLRTAA